MIDRTIAAMLLVVAAIHLIPVAGFFGGSRLRALYGIDTADGTLEILLRHRAVLFGTVGAFFAYAAFVPILQPIAFVGAFISIATFFLLAATVEHEGPAIRKIVAADVVASVCLVLAVALYYLREGH
ncbi:MAG: phosphopantetheine adenylyltransferase [Myxococcota bacterium]